MTTCYAHTHPDHPEDQTQWEPLTDPETGTGHLENVTRYAEEFARDMFANPQSPLGQFAITLARQAGQWHDLGKFSSEFQTYLAQAGRAGEDAHRLEIRGTVDHSTAGAQHARAAWPGVGILLSYIISGHHAGLPDAITTSRACLQARLGKTIPEWKANTPASLQQPPAEPTVPQVFGDIFGFAFLTRMLFSCLCDADFLATELFMSPNRANARPRWPDDIIPRMEAHLTGWMTQRFRTPEKPVQQARAQVLEACRASAARTPGLFSLTVPTGGGKTLSSLAFALRHAARHGQQRVIYAIPFTSIIEQNAEVFRSLFEGMNEEVVLEHHSSFDPERETTTSRLATENWNAPLIVTTNVQLFESLFANRTSRCRKLHHLARSVIILDEAQTLPVSLLAPCLCAMKELVRHYGCTLVLCTATQPALKQRPEEFEIGLENVTEIIPDPTALYDTLKRVDVRQAGQLGITELSARMSQDPRVLTIVNTRRHAADLYQQVVENVGEEGAFHLSAAMCPQHRSEQLAEIRTRLADGKTCRVVATQLIEAGVDVDFPVVYRSIAGIDAIAQAAGRCNRDGKMDRGITWIFEPDPEEHPIPRGYMRQTADTAREILSLHDDALALDTIEHYFRQHYWRNDKLNWDQKQILNHFAPGSAAFPLQFQFAKAAEDFRFIEDTQSPVIIPWNPRIQELIRELRMTHQRHLPPPVGIDRKLQRFTVTVSQNVWKNALANGIIELLHERFAVLTCPELHYRPDTGLCLDTDHVYDPEQLILA